MSAKTKPTATRQRDFWEIDLNTTATRGRPFVSLIAVPREATQTEHLNRVSAKIADMVEVFCLSVGTGGTFHLDDLRRHIQRQSGIAPDSASRVLRDLRARGRLDYAVLSRKNSQYQITKVPK